MRKALAIILSGVLAIVSASVIVRADLEARVRKELKGNYARIVKGFKKNDPSIWEAFLTSDFKLKLFNGSVQDHKWVVDYVRNNAKTFKVLTIEGNDATAVVEQRSSRTFIEQGESHRLDVGALQRETWTETTSGWRLKSVEEWKVLYLVKDGKPMPR